MSWMNQESRHTFWKRMCLTAERNWDYGSPPETQVEYTGGGQAKQRNEDAVIGGWSGYMVDDPFMTVRLTGATLVFLLGAEDDAETVDSFDVKVTLDDGSKWSATLLTLEAILRVMTRWKLTGEYHGGTFFSCPDLIILDRGGVPAAIELLQKLVEANQIQWELVRLATEDD